jgi:Protein of unknown function (DUF4054)
MASSQDVIAFRLQYPEFQALKDPDVSSTLDDADIWLDPDMWSKRDFPTARFLWVAHHLAVLAQIKAHQETMGPLLGFTDQTLQNVSFGERRVGFRASKVQTGPRTYQLGLAAPLGETWYGQMFMLLQSRNIFPIMTV